MNLPKSTVYYYVKNLVRKNSRVELAKLNEWERGYLLGLFVGDGNFDVRKKTYSYRVVFNLNYMSDLPISERIANIIRKASGLVYTTRYKNLLRVICISKRVYEFIRKFVVYKKKRRGNRMINKKLGVKGINGWSKEFKFGFISGMIDSDWYVGPDRGSIRILISTSSNLLARQIYEICKSLGILSTIQKSKNNKTLTVRLSTPSFIKFKNQIKCVKGR